MTVLDELTQRCERQEGPAIPIPGFRRVDLGPLFADLGFTRGAEIGVAKGAFSEHLCKTIPDLELLCVDPWRKYKGNSRAQPRNLQTESFEAAVERLRPYQAMVVRALSSEAVVPVRYGSLDFVHIDGNHRYEHVLFDLSAWSKRVRPGGIISGDDYYDFPRAGVVEAVNDFTQERGITTWWITDDRRRLNHRGARQPAYFWVNP